MAPITYKLEAVTTLSESGEWCIRPVSTKSPIGGLAWTAGLGAFYTAETLAYHAQLFATAPDMLGELQKVAEELARMHACIHQHRATNLCEDGPLVLAEQGILDRLSAVRAVITVATTRRKELDDVKG